MTENLRDFYDRLNEAERQLSAEVAAEPDGFVEVYVGPFSLPDRLVARTDLKADRHNGRLIVHSIHLEPDAPSGSRDVLDEELLYMAQWLDLAGGVVFPA